MADKTSKQPENVAGPWYVDISCIICGMCSEYAPEVFKPSEDYDHNYVFRQPLTPQEIRAAEEARDSCPVDAIGSDGA